MYFDKIGKENTKKTIELAMETAKKRNIKYIVVASSTGETIDYFFNKNDINIICVTHAYGYPTEGKNDMSLIKRKELESKGIKVLTTSHVLSGAERCLSSKFGGISPVEIMAYTLRMFGQGTKVCVEIATMALDSGLIPYMEPVIAIGGSSHGSDTALLLTPSHASKILDTKIHEIICKPNLI